VATSLGLAVVLAASAPLFTAVRLAGAAYLIYLGGRSLLNAVRKSAPAAAGELVPARGLTSTVAAWQGYLSNLANAKMVAFFISLLPQFAGQHPALPLLIALGLNFSLLTLLWLTGYAFAVDRMSRLFRRLSVRRAVDAILGTVLVLLGLRLTREALAQ
jgi:threonine/homoserine/homoserine lactone efflux protein